MTLHRIGRTFIADTARVLGRVTLGVDVNIWYGTVIRGDVAAIAIGDQSNVQDNCVVHCDTGVPNTLGARVTLGHGAIVHGVSIGDDTLVGMGAKLLGGTRIGKRCLIGAGTLVPPNLVVPDDSVVLGVPGRVVRATNDRERAYMKWVVPHYIELARRHCDEPGHPDVTPYAG
jgi:carbonic anhydrase/acetyltransferase-like protein (isoleucine patch superfamily)